MSENKLQTLPPLTPPPAEAFDLPPLAPPEVNAPVTYALSVAALDGASVGAAAPAADTPPPAEHDAMTVAVQVPVFRAAAAEVSTGWAEEAAAPPAAAAAPTGELRAPGRRTPLPRRPATPPPPPVASRRPATPPPLPPPPLPPAPGLAPRADGSGAAPSTADKPADPKPSGGPVRPPLPWAAPAATKRPLPKKARVVIGAIVAVVVLTIVSQRCARSGSAPPLQLAVKSDSIVAGDELKNRREVSPNDFATKGDLRTANGWAQPPEATGPARVAAPVDLDARHARREVNPDDLLHRGSRVPRGSGGTRAAARAKADDEDSFLVTPTATETTTGVEPSVGGARKSASRVLAPAGTVLSATLTTPVQVGGGSAETVVATVEGQGPLHMARLVGVASASGERVSIRFRKLLLADGTEVNVSGEAQDQDGGFGLAVTWPAGARSSVGREVAEETATETVLDAVGGGILGTAARKYNDKSRPGAANDRPEVTLPAGQPIEVFLHESAQVRE